MTQLNGAPPMEIKVKGPDTFTIGDTTSFHPYVTGGVVVLVKMPSVSKSSGGSGNCDQFIVQTRFVCQFNVEGRVKSVSASLIGDMVYCDEEQFDYNSPAPNITASFAVIWGSSKTLDNPHNIQVLIYRCRLMANNCGL
ncbi:unnamed protein product [Cyprideis torosa]|uniref:Uncharacterized protein n=1 Tax=Cyprideis torosa TaxID=163714 RepID=A0A7R8WSW9_9CRUS|nr:unnamed protein product [Cyprideis torosa]CAG0905178.1 unnamed protein product [Cyprideis torosa]